MGGLDRLRLLRQRGRDGVEADRPAFEFEDDGLEQLAIQWLEAELVDVQHGQRLLGDFQRCSTVAADLRVVAHTTEQAGGRARCAARAPRGLPNLAAAALEVEA